MIGVGANRTTPLGNQYNGVRVYGDNNVIGPNNLIAHNQLSGIMLSGRNSKIFQNTISSNARSGICVVGPGTQIMTNTIDYNGEQGTFQSCRPQPDGFACRYTQPSTQYAMTVRADAAGSFKVVEITVTSSS